MKEKNLIYGVHPVLEALESGVSIEKIMVRKGSRNEAVEKAAKVAGLQVQQVPEEALDRHCPNVTHQGVLAFVSAIVYYPLEDVIIRIQEKGETPLFVLLDGVTDVRNFGAIARTAECLGVHALIVPIQGSAPANADAVKTSAGALLHLPVCREKHLVDSLNMLHAYGIETVGLTEKASDTLFEIDFKKPTCLVYGSEQKGISPSLLKRVSSLAKIPLTGKVNSLNVSVAVGMGLLEVSRQRIS